MTYSPRNFAGLLWFVAIAIVLFSHNRVSHAAEVKTLVIVSHPYPEQSVLTKGLQAAAQSVPALPYAILRRFTAMTAAISMPMPSVD